MAYKVTWILNNVETKNAVEAAKYAASYQQSQHGTDGHFIVRDQDTDEEVSVFLDGVKTRVLDRDKGQIVWPK